MIERRTSSAGEPRAPRCSPGRAQAQARPLVTPSPPRLRPRGGAMAAVHPAGARARRGCRRARLPRARAFRCRPDAEWCSRGEDSLDRPCRASTPTPVSRYTTLVRNQLSLWTAARRVNPADTTLSHKPMWTRSLSGRAPRPATFLGDIGCSRANFTLNSPTECRIHEPLSALPTFSTSPLSSIQSS